MRWRDLGLIGLAFLAACGGGNATSLGRVHVALSLTSGPGSGFGRQNDTLGNACGALADVGIALAGKGDATVRDQANTIVGVASFSPGTLTDLTTLPGGQLVDQKCLVSFDVDVKDKPSFLTFELSWTGSSKTITARVDANEVRGGKLEISQTIS